MKEPWNILVVDDSPPTCFYLKRLLEKQGYRVLTATDGQSGYQLAREENPDLIILDEPTVAVSFAEIRPGLRQDVGVDVDLQDDFDGSAIKANGS